MSRVIPLAGGYDLAIVDDEDFTRLSAYRWHVHKSRGGYKYAQSGRRAGMIQMAQLVLGLPRSQLVDHVNGHTLDNRRCNLRPATRSQNMANSVLRCTNTSGYRGVRQTPKATTWTATIWHHGTRMHLGCFRTKEEAAAAYARKAKELHGDFVLAQAQDGPA